MLRLCTLLLILLLPAVSLADMDQPGGEALDAHEKADLKMWLDSGDVEIGANHNVVFIRKGFWAKLKDEQKENLARVCNTYYLNRVGNSRDKMTTFYTRNLNNRLATYSANSGFKAK